MEAGFNSKGRSYLLSAKARFQDGLSGFKGGSYMWMLKEGAVINPHSSAKNKKREN